MELFLRVFERFAYKWRVLLLAYLCIIAYSISFQAIPPLLPFLVDDLAMTYSQAGLLMGFFTLPGIFIALPGGYLSDVMGTKRVALFSLIFVMAGTFATAFADNYHTMVLGRIISGIGGLTLAVVSPKIVVMWFQEDEIPLAMGLFNTAFPLGTLAAFLVFGKIGSHYGWKIPLILTGFMVLVILGVFAIYYRQDEPKNEKISLLPDLRRVNANILLLGFAWLLFTSATLAFTTFAPDYFASSGMQVARGGFLASLLIGASLILSPFVGIFLRKKPIFEEFIFIGAVSMAILFSLVNRFSGDPIILMVLIGLFSGLIPASIFSLPSRIMPVELYGTAFGILYTFLNIGILIIPFSLGRARDLTGDYDLSFMIISVLSMSLAMISVVLKIRRTGSIFSRE